MTIKDKITYKGLGAIPWALLAGLIAVVGINMACSEPPSRNLAHTFPARADERMQHDIYKAGWEAGYEAGRQAERLEWYSMYDEPLEHEHEVPPTPPIYNETIDPTEPPTRTINEYPPPQMAPGGPMYQGGPRGPARGPGMRR